MDFNLIIAGFATALHKKMNKLLERKMSEVDEKIDNKMEEISRFSKITDQELKESSLQPIHILKGSRGERGLAGEAVIGPQGNRGKGGKRGLQGMRGKGGQDGVSPDVTPFVEELRATLEKSVTGSLIEIADSKINEAVKIHSDKIQKTLDDNYISAEKLVDRKIGLLNQNLRSELGGLKIQISDMISAGHAGGGGTSGGGSVNVLQMDDVQFSKRHEVEGNSILIFDANKKKFVSESFSDILARLELTIGTNLEVQYNKLIDFDGDITYIGEAEPGTNSNNPTWRIKRIETLSDGDTSILWVNGSADFIHTWDDRLTYNYS